jgi:hypothetical protein
MSILEDLVTHVTVAVSVIQQLVVSQVIGSVERELTVRAPAVLGGVLAVLVESFSRVKSSVAVSAFVFTVVVVDHDAGHGGGREALGGYQAR